jgi:methyl-CpG-binding domain protein 2
LLDSLLKEKKGRMHHKPNNAGRSVAHPPLLGKWNSLLSKTKQKKSDSSNISGLGSDLNLVAPIRQTASIFKQPVTLYKDHKSKVKSDLKTVNKEKPSQLFWAKRLGNLRPGQFEDSNKDQEQKSKLTLPKVAVVGPGITEKMLLASISTHLHLYKEPAYGQKDSMDLISKNPAAYINPSQPLMQSVKVSDEDISAAEERVKAARNNLALAIKGLV